MTADTCLGSLVGSVRAGRAYVRSCCSKGLPPSICLNGMRADQQMHLMGYAPTSMGPFLSGVSGVRASPQQHQNLLHLQSRHNGGGRGPQPPAASVGYQVGLSPHNMRPKLTGAQSR